jgi:pyruvate formate lyase activating enzyme
MGRYRQVPFLSFVVSPYQKVKINLAGCNFDCRACFAIAKHEVGRNLSVEGLIDLLVKSCQRIYGHTAQDVQLTGGEPTADTEYLLSLIRKLRELGVSRIGLSTNGYLLDRSLVRELKAWGVNYIKLALKAYSDKIHRLYTGKGNSSVLNAVELLSEYNLNFYVRTIYIPNMVDSDEVEKIAKFLSRINGSITYKIYQFSPEQGHSEVLTRRPTQQEMARAFSLARRYLSNVEFETTATAYEPDSRYVEVRADELLEDFKKIDAVSKSVVNDWQMPYLTMNEVLKG